MLICLTFILAVFARAVPCEYQFLHSVPCGIEFRRLLSTLISVNKKKISLTCLQVCRRF